MSWRIYRSAVMLSTVFSMVGAGMPRSADLITAFTNVQVDIKTYRDFRDEKIVKQDLDYSCGAASLATILKYYYKLEVTEDDILEFTGEGARLSFDDLRKAAQRYGFKAFGRAMDFDSLKKSIIPSIVYVRYRGEEDHFSVIRGINDDNIVHLGDPAWGNRRFTKSQFLAMWETDENETLAGKALFIVPGHVGFATINENFFGQPASLSPPGGLLQMR